MASGGVYRSDPFRPVLPSVGHYGVKLESEGSESDTDSEAGGQRSSSDEALDTLTPYPPLHQPKGGARRRSEEDYVPSPTQSGGSREEEEEEEESSESSSASASSDSAQSLQRQVSRPKLPRKVDLSDDEEELRPRQRPAHGHEVCPPRRKAARIVNYQEFYQSEDDESSAGEAVGRRGRGRRRRGESDSEFEVTVRSEVSSEESLETSEDEYMEGSGQRRRGGGRRKVSYTRSDDCVNLCLVLPQGWAESDSDSDYTPGAGGKSRRRRKRKTAGRRKLV